MVIVSVDLSRQENRKVGSIKAIKDFKSKEEAIKYLIGEYDFNDRFFDGADEE